MDGEAWKISPPKSHPSNPVHKAAMKEQNKEVLISSNFPLTSRRSLSDHKSRHRQWSLCQQFFWQVCWFGRVNFSAWRTVPSERRPQQELTAKCVPPERRCLALSCNVENWSSRSSRWGRAKETLGFFCKSFSDLSPNHCSALTGWSRLCGGRSSCFPAQRRCKQNGPHKVLRRSQVWVAHRPSLHGGQNNARQRRPSCEHQRRCVP